MIAEVLVNPIDKTGNGNYIVKCCGDKYDDRQRKKNYVWRE